MKHIIFLFFVFVLSSSYAQNESKQSINKDFKTTENKIKYTDTRLFAQCMFDIPIISFTKYAFNTQPNF